MGRRLVCLSGPAPILGFCAASWGWQRDLDIPVAEPAPIVDGEADAIWDTASARHRRIDTGETLHSNAKDCSVGGGLICIDDIGLAKS